MKNIQKTRRQLYRFLFITLGFLSAFGPFVTDMYLPSLPSLAKEFSTSNSMAQLSLTMSMLGLAIGQIIIGPVSDKHGRKKLLLISLAVYLVSTVCCIFSPGIETFNLMRLFQGMAGAGGIVLSRSIATDLYSGERLTQFISMIAAINGIAPVIAPVIGGIILSVSTWKTVFWVLLAIGLILMLLSLRLRESLSQRNRLNIPLVSSFVNYKNLVHNKTYLIHFGIYMFSAAVLFSYISASSFILQDFYELSSLGFSLCFAVNAVAIAIGCSAAGRLHGKKSLKLGAVIMVFGALLSIVSLILLHSIVLTEINFIILMFSFGLLQPVPTAIALDSERSNAGVASAALGASGFLMGGLVAPIVGIGNMLVTTSVIFITGALITAAFVYISLKLKKKA
ncbi:MAG: multidrug effflux MFS transporter [Bacteroidales bacterium]|nr:multidrug effflux MFS transporter [Bacteroidales bacterium]